MIVLIDTKNRCIKLYSDEGLQTIDFENAETLDRLIGNNIALYVTGIIPAKAADIIKTIKILEQKLNKQSKPKANEPLYLCPGVDGAINIPGLMNKKTGKRDEIVLSKNPSLPRSRTNIPLKIFYETYGDDVLQKNPYLSSLFKLGKIKIMPQSQFRARQIDFEKKQNKMEDEQLSEIVGDSEGIKAASTTLSISDIQNKRATNSRIQERNKRYSTIQKESGSIILDTGNNECESLNIADIPKKRIYSSYRQTGNESELLMGENMDGIELPSQMLENFFSKIGIDKILDQGEKSNDEISVIEPPKEEGRSKK